ncbi:hypothetical protein DESUT3_03980 [Desulfuromonas versatilis]|uniref:histidine kinase n=1 Tax=Desulfuromonas versatilis TaxID=2802975 RepID=A0ABN6DTV2_9BACT|nr:PAS domain-containing protein [Desulfuromonas versatilis]BCR03329.1 hypothetical protein DESUT3_03980 [Desulfuromonas versatilis]
MNERNARTLRAALKAAAIYTLLAGGWILVSDRILLALIRDPDLLTRAQTLKGWFFVLASAGLLAWLVNHYLGALRREDEMRRGTARELDRRGKLLANIISNIPLYVFWKGRDSAYLGCNQRFASVAGVGRPENIVGKTDEELAWRGKDAELTRLRDRQVLDSRKPLLELEETLLLADGQPATYLTSRVPLLDEAGEVIGLLGICSDITLRKRAEQELRQALQEAEQARDKVRGIVGSVAEGLLVTDRDSRVVLVNQAAEELLGVKQQLAQGQPLEQVVHQPQVAERLAPLLARRQGGASLELQLPGPDPRQPRHLQARTSVIQDQAGEVSGMIAILLDVTREHELERMKTDFIATSARDLRGPLASILGFSELLLARKPIDSDERNRFLAYIHQEAQSLARIVKDRLDIALLESGGELGLDLAPTDLAALLRRMVDYFQEKNPAHRFELQVGEQAAELLLDGERIEQVLHNLLGNAVRYSPGGGSVRVAAQVEPEGCRIRISDQGRGMPPAERRRVFEKFYRGERSSQDTEGLGLGMTIARHIVEAHGGSIEVESEEGRGTTVSVCIPLGMAAQASRAAQGASLERENP